jgi:hypothetical protein
VNFEFGFDAKVTHFFPITEVHKYILHGADIHCRKYYLISRISQETDGQSQLAITFPKKPRIHEAD